VARIRYTATARNDLGQIYRYIQDQSGSMKVVLFDEREALEAFLRGTAGYDQKLTINILLVDDSIRFEKAD
jgi:hypothetical protein